MKLSEQIDSLIPVMEDALKEHEKKTARLQECYDLMYAILAHPDCTRGIKSVIEQTITRLERI